MDRERRKANLKKLQLPGTVEGTRQQRKSSKTTATDTPTISKYFLTPEKQISPINVNIDDNLPNFYENNLEPKIIGNTIPDTDKEKLPANPSRLKRIKLDTFVFKDPQNIPKIIKNRNKPLNEDDDLVVPEKKVKTAPKLPCTSSQTQTKRGKSSKTKKQTTIKSAFFRNEQIFAEIAAQHCAADQFDGEDVQLALAISRSEAESTGMPNGAGNGSEDVVNLVDGKKDPVSLIEKLKNYGFRTAEKKDYNAYAAAFLPKANGRRPKFKWANKFTPLTLRNPESQNKKLQDNITSLLNKQLQFKQLLDDEQLQKRSYELQSSLLEKCDMQTTIIDKVNNTNTTNHQYFVVELFEINELPAGHLLKDWSNIQGRDLSPTAKSQQSRERLIMLENLYKELEEFFSSRKTLDLTLNSQTKEEHGVIETTMQEEENLTPKTNNICDLKSSNAISIEDEKDEHEMIDLIDDLNENECSVTNSSLEKIKNILPPVKSLDMMNVSVDYKAVEKENENLQVQKNYTFIKTDASDKIECNLPPVKSLDTMQVSSCNSTTEASFSLLQNTRSNSPDLFADSDIEETIDDAESKVVNVEKVDKKSNSCLDDMNEITTYEIYSSDEVKNTSSTEHNNQLAGKETPIGEQLLVTKTIIDLTQDDLEMHEPQLNTSKAIVEIDLFAESPLKEDHEIEIDINSNSQQSKYLQATEDGTFKFTLSLQSTENEQETANEQVREPKDDTIKFIRKSMETKQYDILEDNGHDENDLVLREIAMDQTNLSFFTFEGTKQLETCLHKETAVGEADILKDSFIANDTIFRELCNKYLGDVSEHRTPSENKTDNYLRRSFTQPLANIKTPKKLENTIDISPDLKMIRNSNSFNTKTPKKSKNSNDFILSKSQSFNYKSDISIDLTQNEDDVNGIATEDDDCLMLSDDEINYSIWQANKTGNLKTSDTSMSINEEDAISIPENCLNDQKANNKLTEEAVIDFPNKNHVDFDYMDLLEKESSTVKSKDVLPTSKSGEFNFDRSEFGILEEHSIPIDYASALCTPTKHLTNVSFLNSPTEKTAPMKRYSNRLKSLQKFNDLLNDLDKQSPKYNDFQDFDEFDHLGEESPFKTNNYFKKPEGLEQLLTAEISFNASQKSPLIKTPIKSFESFSATQEFNYNNKTYTIRCITSPKPDYTQYSESELLKKLYNFGIKPLKRKQAVKILEYIYNQTHPILLDDDVNEKQLDNINVVDDDVPSTSKSHLKSLRKTSSSVMNTFDISCSLSSQSVEKEKESNESLESSQRIAKETLKDANNKLVLKDASGMEMLRYSIDLKAELLDEKYIFQTNVTRKTPQPLLPFHIAWYNLVCSNHKLHETILMFEPLDLQQIYLFLKDLGYRYDPKDLKVFFDRRSIIFRYGPATKSNKQKKNKWRFY